MNYFAFQWHITEACDQRCKHCYIYALGSRAQFREMSWPAMKQTLEAMLHFCRKAQRRPYLYLTGGDPLLHPDFHKLTALLHKQSIPFAVLGNPFHVDAAEAQRLKNHGCHKYQLSLDGLEETHDQIRKTGSFRETLQTIPVLHEAGIPVVIMATVSRLNQHEIPGLMDVVVAHQADAFAFARYCPSAADRAVCCSATEYKELLEACWLKQEQYKNSNTWFSFKDHLWTLFRYEKGLFTIDESLDSEMIYDGCNCGNCHLTILSDGAVYACRRMESKIGNVLQDDLWALFRGREMEAYRNYENYEKCSRCELLRFCRGCPAVAAGYHGSMYAADPQCWKEIKEINELKS